MYKDSAKLSGIAVEEHKEAITATAQRRIADIQRAAADLFADSLIACLDNLPSLSEHLWEAQNTFFSEINSHIPINVDTDSTESIERARAINLSQRHLIVIANHPPFEKTVSPSETQFQDALRRFNKQQLVSQIDNMKNLPAGIMRRAVIHYVMQKIYPHVEFRYHVVGSRYRPPLNVVQENDGTIIVPYANEETNGFNMLLNGLNQIYERREDAAHIHVCIAFPEGEQPRVIEELKPFHAGIFAAAEKLTFEKNIPVTILPIVMTVTADFSIRTRVLSPIQPELLWKEKQFASTLQQQFQHVYLHMLQSMPDGYYWQGMMYPFGGLSRSDILNIPKK